MDNAPPARSVDERLDGLEQRLGEINARLASAVFLNRSLSGLLLLAVAAMVFLLAFPDWLPGRLGQKTSLGSPLREGLREDIYEVKKELTENLLAVKKELKQDIIEAKSRETRNAAEILERQIQNRADVLTMINELKQTFGTSQSNPIDVKKLAKPSK